MNDVPLGSTDVVLVLRRIATDRTLEILVLDPDGTPIEGALVLVFQVPRGGPPLRVPRTDAQGRARLEDLREDGLEVGVLHNHTPDEPWTAPQPVEVVPDGQVLTIRLIRARQIVGRVLGPDGTPPGGHVVVRIERGDGTVVNTAASTREGFFYASVPLDEEGPLYLMVEARVAGAEPARTKVDVPPPGAEPITIHLDR